jgi:hypothetical protein
MIWKVEIESGGMSPLGGLTRNLLGDEVWILNAIGFVGFSDLSWIVVRHLVWSVNSIRTSAGSHTSTSFSIYQAWLGWNGGSSGLGLRFQIVSRGFFFSFWLYVRKVKI